MLEISCLMDPFTRHCSINCGFNTSLEIIKLQKSLLWKRFSLNTISTILWSILPWTLSEQASRRVLPCIREVSKLWHQQRSLCHGAESCPFPDRYKHRDISRLLAVRGSFTGKAHSWLEPQSSHIMHTEHKSSGQMGPGRHLGYDSLSVETHSGCWGVNLVL